MAPLSPDEFQAGRRIKMDNTELDVHGVVVGTNAAQFLVVSEPNNYVCGIIPVAAVQEAGEAVDPETVHEDRQAAADQADGAMTPQTVAATADSAPATITADPGAPGTTAPVAPGTPAATPAATSPVDLTDDQVNAVADRLYERLRNDRQETPAAAPVTDVPDVPGSGDRTPPSTPNQ